MGKKYLLGPNAARFLHEAMNESQVSRRTLENNFIETVEFADPWTLRYSSSVYVSGSGQNEVRGGWIMWIPPGSISGYDVNDQQDASFARPLTQQLDHMPTGWWLLSSDLSNALNQDGEHSVFADVGAGGIVLRLTHGPVHVADVVVDATKKSKNVKQIARSVVTLFPKPFDVYWNGISFVFERQYFNVGAKTYTTNVSGSSIHDALPCIVALKIGLAESQPTTAIVTASGIPSLQEMQSDEKFAVVPLYQLDIKGNIVCDFRSGVIAVTGEF